MHAVAATFRVAAGTPPDGGVLDVLLFGVVVVVLVVLLFDVVVLGLLDPPQPAMSATLAIATAANEDSCRVIVPPWDAVAGARPAVGAECTAPLRSAHDSGQVGRWAGRREDRPMRQRIDMR